MKNIFLVFIAMTSFAFAANAQSCCQSKDKAKCTKKTESAVETATASNVKAVLVTNTSTATAKTEKFTVYGNCGMCERTIENALKDVDGVSKGDWDREMDVMTVVFNPEKISLDDIKQKIADVGYDSDTHRAEDEVYNSLPGCCQYERPVN